MAAVELYIKNKQPGSSMCEVCMREQKRNGRLLLLARLEQLRKRSAADYRYSWCC